MKFKIYSIVLGGTDSLLNIKLPDGYEFRRVRTNETLINKKIRSLDGNLLAQYCSSNLSNNHNEPEFICIYKCIEIENNIEQYQENTFREIEKIVSLLQIFKEGYISLYSVFYVTPKKINYTVVIDCKPYLMGDKYFVSDNEATNLQNFLCLEESVYDRLDILIRNYFNSTKFIDCFMQLQYLVTIGEILVLNKDTSKKESFSKRLAILVEDTNEDKKSTYKSLRNIYKLRGNWVHDGDYTGIDLNEVNKMRIIISKAIKLYIQRIRKEMQNNQSITFKQVKLKIIRELNRDENRLGNGFFKE